MFYRILNVIYSVKNKKTFLAMGCIYFLQMSNNNNLHCQQKKKLYRDYLIHYVWLFIHKDAVLAFGFVI